MIDHERERHDALRKDPPPIGERYYRRYSDEIGRMGGRWFERVVSDWEWDQTESIKGNIQ